MQHEVTPNYTNHAPHLGSARAYPDASITVPTSDWSYVAEGGATIVFAYVGPPHPNFNGTVLRLRKSPRTDAYSLQHSPPMLHDTPGEEPDDLSISFQDIVTSKLVPKAHLPRLQAVKVSSRWLQELSAIVEAQRPVDRRAKDGIDVSRSKGVLATDLVGGRGWAVEIKPKWGFLPNTTYLSPVTLPLKARYCRFCMHTHLKKKNEISTAGGYCPLDLFSGNVNRVKLALSKLWDAWIQSQGKVNNLRIFVNGSIVNPGDPTSYNCLAAQFTAAPVNPQSQFIEALLPLLMDTPLLSTISQLQRNLDPLDIEGLCQLWSKIHPGVPLGRGVPDPSLAEWGEFVDTFKSGLMSEAGEESLRYKILAFLLSATFKDCSIILRLGQDDIDGTGRTGDTITVIDVDPKSPSHLAKWEALDQEILKHFAEVATKRESCLDARVGM